MPLPSTVSRRLAAAIIVVGAGLLAGCAMQQETPPTRFYVLGSLGSDTAPST